MLRLPGMENESKTATTTIGTVGIEFEVKNIVFLIVDTDPITNRKIVSAVPGDKVLPIFTETPHRIRCDQDNTQLTKEFTADLLDITNRGNYQKPEVDTVHIFEFVTLPTGDQDELVMQLKAIEYIETDLICYLLRESEKSQENRFTCVRDWINDYNLRHKSNPLPLTPDSARMQILLKPSIEKLLAPYEDHIVDELSYSQGNEGLAQFIQKNLIHYVQYNFVTALSSHMGSMLLAVFEADNQMLPLLSRIEELKTRLSKKGESKLTPTEILHIEAELAYTQVLLRHLELKLAILKLAEHNAERACHLIRSLGSQNQGVFDRKILKLEGFFFLLSMRLLTETTDMLSMDDTSSKNKYLFFLKTKLSDLVHSLSQDDRDLLQNANQTWSDTEKHDLLAIIAGSSEALTACFSEVLTVKAILESALGWSEDARPLCDLLPNAPLKQLDPPRVPLGAHRKTQQAPERHVLLENRGRSHETLAQSQQNAHELFQRAEDFCMTTYLHGQDAAYLTKEMVAEYLMQSYIQDADKAHYVHILKLHHPALLAAFQSEHPSEMKKIAAYTQKINQDKIDLQICLERTDEQVAEAIDHLSTLTSFPSQESFEYTHLQIILKTILCSSDADLTLRNINYLYLKCQDTTLVSPALKEPLERMLMRFYAEQVIAMFNPVKNSLQMARVKYIKDRYALSKKIPAVLEFLTYSDRTTLEVQNDIQVALREENQVLQLKYTIKSSPGSELNASDAANSLLHHACALGLTSLIRMLVQRGIQAETADLVAAVNAKVFNADLASVFINAGTDLNPLLSHFARERDTSQLLALTKILGMSALEKAIQAYSQSKPSHEIKLIIIYLTKAKELFMAEQKQSLSPSNASLDKVTPSLPPHSVLFPNESKEALSPLVIAAFKSDLAEMLSKYTGADRQIKATIEVLILSVNPQKITEADLYERLRLINEEMECCTEETGTTKNLRSIVCPILLDLLQCLSLPDEADLKTQFSTAIATRKYEQR